jgi:hypothetical protein
MSALLRAATSLAKHWRDEAKYFEGRCDRDKFNGSEGQLEKLWGAKAHKGERPIG